MVITSINSNLCGHDRYEKILIISLNIDLDFYIKQYLNHLFIVKTVKELFKLKKKENNF